MLKKVSVHQIGRWGLCLLALAGLMLACTLSPQAAPTPSPAAPELVQPTPASPTATTELPEPTPPPADTQPAGQPSAGVQQVLIYLIALEDNGVAGPLVGCGDSAVPVTVEIPATEGVLRATLESLLALKDQYYGESGLYNALYQSDLQVQGVVILEGDAQIYLTGSLLQGGECDSPRIQAQLEQTARQFSTVQTVSIFLNDVPLQDVLSLQGP